MIIEPTDTFIGSERLRIALYDLGGSGPPLLLVHATGFCAAVLAPMANVLKDRFHCFALDVRAHGRSDAPDDANFDWHGFGDDVASAVDDLGLVNPFGFGHSCGGAALLLAEQARPGIFKALYCYEPVIYPGEIPLEPSKENPLSQGALRRRSQFPSREEALANFSSKPPFNRLDASALEAYVDNGFRIDETGSLTLRCRREYEAEIYAHGFAHDAFARLPEVPCPVTVACGAQTDGFGPDFIELFAKRLVVGSTDVLAGLGHFGPLEDPGSVASSVLRAIG